jgi:hypothetical protein
MAAVLSTANTRPVSMKNSLLPNTATALFTIRSAAFSNVYLRMDGSGITAPALYGAGVVNSQYNFGLYEKFYIKPPLF